MIIDSRRWRRIVARANEIHFQRAVVIRAAQDRQIFVLRHNTLQS